LKNHGLGSKSKGIEGERVAEAQCGQKMLICPLLIECSSDKRLIGSWTNKRIGWAEPQFDLQAKQY
jgi:hypothetical protein